MGHTYESLYLQDEASDLGYSAVTRNDAALDKANSKAKPKAYSGKIKKGGSKPKKQPPGSGRLPVDSPDRMLSEMM